MAKRPTIPLSVKLEVALRQLAVHLCCHREELELDHVPALRLRATYTDTNGVEHLMPDANDPTYMQWIPRREHLEKTTGRRGTSKLSQRGGDIAEIAKTKRLENKRLGNVKEKRKWKSRSTFGRSSSRKTATKSK